MNPPPSDGLERPRVLLIAPQPFFIARGTPINVLLLCRALTSLGISVDLLTATGGTAMVIPGVRQFRAPALSGSGDLPVGFSIGKLGCNVLMAGVTVGRLARTRYDAVHAIEEAAFFAVPIARLFGVRTIMDLDSDIAGQLRDSPKPPVRILAAPARWLRRMVLRRANAALSVAPAVTRIVREANASIPVSEIRDVPLEESVRPPVLDRVAAIRAALGLNGRRTIVYTGNFDHRQGVEHAIHAMAHVVERFPDAVLILVGGTPDRMAALAKLSAAAGLADAVRLVGPRPPEDMPEFMGLADVLVSPRLEPLITPLKIFAYMASGRPIVATDLPTHSTVLDASSAVLVPPTARGLADGIIDLLDAPERALVLGTAAQRLVRERYTFERFRNEVGALYETLLQQPAAKAGARLDATSAP